MRNRNPVSPLPYVITKKILNSQNRKPWHWFFQLSDGFEIWQVPWQSCCKTAACKMWKRYNDLSFQSRGFETSRDLKIGCLMGSRNCPTNRGLARHAYKYMWHSGIPVPVGRDQLYIIPDVWSSLVTLEWESYSGTVIYNIGISKSHCTII